MQTLAGALLGIAILASGAAALEAQQATYVNGTVAALKPGTIGTLDSSPSAALQFHAGNGSLSIPYAKITSFQYKEEAKFHLGVLPAIAVALVKKRAKVHFLTIVWDGESGAAQVATLEMSRRDAEGMLEVLHARAQQACKPKSSLLSRGLPLGASLIPLPATPPVH